ncbi:MAG: hypothetical protein ACOCW3_03425 [Spirochaetota bacterium]
MPEAERRRRRRHVVLLAVAVVAFAAMIALVATGVTRRRNARDLTFGLEELDILLDDGSVAEAAAMIPWLADRVRTSAEGLRILKRGHALYESDGLAAPLDEAASRLLREFPANATIRAIAVFASVRAGRADAALELARDGLGGDAGTLYAWTLLSNPDARLDGEPTDELLLAGLRRTSPAADFERAWRLTGDRRYALDAALLHLRDRSPDRAAELLTAAGLVQRWPGFAAEVLLDCARYTEAIAVLAKLPESSAEAQLQLADANVYAGEQDAARAIYERLLLLGRPPLHALLGLASLDDDPERQALLIDRAAGLYPDAWEAARAQAVTGAGSGADALAGWDGTEHEGLARLLRLRLEARPDRRGYAARLWTLLSEHPSEEGYRYAAWYFASRDARDDLRLVLERARAGGDEASWWLAYHGILAAATGRWDEAASRFEAAFVRSPAWQPALNAAVALARAGDPSGARARLQDALLLARHSSSDRRIAVFLVAARAARDPAEARRIVAEAIAIDPDHPNVVLLDAQLEKAPVR